MDDIRYLIENSHTSYNRYNVKAVPHIQNWSENYIVDEEQSVKWNREQVDIHNKEVDKAWKKYRSDLKAGYKNFCTDLKQAIQNDYKFTESQATIIMAHIYNDGMYDDLDRAEELCEIVSEVLQAYD